MGEKFCRALAVITQMRFQITFAAELIAIMQVQRVGFDVPVIAVSAVTEINNVFIKMMHGLPEKCFA